MANKGLDLIEKIKIVHFIQSDDSTGFNSCDRIKNESFFLLILFQVIVNNWMSTIDFWGSDRNEDPLLKAIETRSFIHLSLKIGSIQNKSQGHCPKLCRQYAHKFTTSPVREIWSVESHTICYMGLSRHKIQYFFSSLNLSSLASLNMKLFMQNTETGAMIYM